MKCKAAGEDDSNKAITSCACAVRCASQTQPHLYRHLNASVTAALSCPSDAPHGSSSSSGGVICEALGRRLDCCSGTLALHTSLSWEAVRSTCVQSHVCGAEEGGASTKLGHGSALQGFGGPSVW